jgi:hypothetical protein
MEFGEFEMMRTHPPIDQRIARLLGGRAEPFKHARARHVVEARPAQAALRSGGMATESMSPLFAAGVLGGDPAERVSTSVTALLASVGNPSTAHMREAQRLLEALPAPLHEAAGNAESGRAVLCALLLAGEGEARTKQLDAIRATLGEEDARRAASFAELLRPLGPCARLPLFDLALPSLKRMDEVARAALLRLAGGLAMADSKVNIGEFVLLTLCRRHLGPAPNRAPPVKHRHIKNVAREASVVMWLLARSGIDAAAGSGDARGAYDNGVTALGIAGDPPEVLNVTSVEAALYELKLLAPLVKPQFIKACLAVVIADGRLAASEGELMRAICAAIDTPLPLVIESGTAPEG